MGLKLENILSGLVLFSILVSLTFGIYSNIASEYGVTPDYTDDDGKSVIEALNDINVISGLEEVKDSIESLYSGGSVTGSEYDILGTLRAAAIGVVKVGTGILTAPLEIIGVVTGFYTLPSSLSIGLGLIIIIYLGYMLINEYLGK